MERPVSSERRQSAPQRFLPTAQLDVGRRISRMARAGVQSMTIDLRFDVEAYHSDHPLPDRSSSSPSTRSSRLSSGTDSQRLRSANVGSIREGGIGESEEQQHDPEKAEQQEAPYHILSHKQKWVLIWIIGIAGLFSGLSSNIYFPSLDLIARVRETLN